MPDGGRCLTAARLLAALYSSPATLKRGTAHLCDRMNAPVVSDRLRCGYRLNAGQALTGAQYGLPGSGWALMKSTPLLTVQHLLANLDAGDLLGPHIAPLQTRLGKRLDSGASSHAGLARRIRVQTVGARRLHVPQCQAVGSAPRCCCAAWPTACTPV